MIVFDIGVQSMLHFWEMTNGNTNSITENQANNIYYIYIEYNVYEFPFDCI